MLFVQNVLSEGESVLDSSVSYTDSEQFRSEDLQEISDSGEGKSARLTLVDNADSQSNVEEEKGVEEGREEEEHSQEDYREEVREEEEEDGMEVQGSSLDQVLSNAIQQKNHGAGTNLQFLHISQGSRKRVLI